MRAVSGGSRDGARRFPHVTCTICLGMGLVVLFLHEPLINMVAQSDDVLAAASADGAEDGVSGTTIPDFSATRARSTALGGRGERGKGGKKTKKRDMSEVEKEEARVNKCDKWRAAVRAGVAEAFEGEVDGVSPSETPASIPQTKKYCHAKSGKESHCMTAYRSKINQKSVRPYRGVHKGQSAVLFCTGPTMDAFKLEGVDAHGNDAAGRKVLLVGVNSIVLRKDLAMDYVFVQDRGAKTGDTGYLANKEEMDAYRPGIQKFFGRFTGWSTFGPSGEHAKAANASRYDGGKRPLCNREPHPLVRDVGNFNFGGSCSTIFSALQFILYTGIDQLFVVGCDVGGGGYSASAKKSDVADTKKPANTDYILDNWKMARHFINAHYPCVRVTVVRPMGLKAVPFLFIDENPIFSGPSTAPAGSAILVKRGESGADDVAADTSRAETPVQTATGDDDAGSRDEGGKEDKDKRASTMDESDHAAEDSSGDAGEDRAVATERETEDPDASVSEAAENAGDRPEEDADEESVAEKETMRTRAKMKIMEFMDKLDEAENEEEETPASGQATADKGAATRDEEVSSSAEAVAEAEEVAAPENTSNEGDHARLGGTDTGEEQENGSASAEDE